MRRILLAAGAATLVLTTSLTAQTTVYSTFGSGDSYNGGLGWTVGSSDLLGSDYGAAESFLFGGTSGSLLYGIRFAAFVNMGNLAVAFLGGSDLGTASVLDSWTVPGGGSDGIYSLTSSLQPALTNGQTYWIRMLAATSGTWWAWNLNDQGINGHFGSVDGGATWQSYPNDALGAFDVSTIPGQDVVPEPGTMTLLATGLLGLAVQRKKRRV